MKQHLSLKALAVAFLAAVIPAGTSFAALYTVTMSPDSTGNYVCDGVDDHVQLNLALSAAEVSAGLDTLYLKGPADYNIDTTLFVGSSIVITGDSTAAIRLANNANWATYVPMIRNKNSSNRDIFIYGFEIDGNDANNYDYDAAAALTRYRGHNWYNIFYFESVKNLHIHDMYLHHNENDALNTKYCDSVYYHDNSIYLTGHDGLYGYKSSHLWAYNNVISIRTNSALRFYDANHVVCYGNTMFSAGNGGGCAIEVEKDSPDYPMNDLDIYENTIYTTSGAGFWIFASNHSYSLSEAYLHIHNNTVYNCGGRGITTDGFNMLLENNVIDGCSGGLGVSNVYSSSPPITGVVIQMRNNIIYSSGTAIYNSRPTQESIALENNCLYGNSTNYSGTSIAYTDDIYTDPLFANRSGHDYHLKSTTGRWNGAAWVNDTASSPCIDAGYAGSDFSNEPFPNGTRVNIGRYGNTAEASKSASGSIVYVTMSPDSTGSFVCDGTDDDVEINAALALADTSDDYDTVYLKGPATYLVGDTLMIGGSTTLLGNSTTVVKVKDSSGLTGFVLYSKNVLSRSINRDITISGFEIDGNRANNATSYALCTMDSAQNVAIFDMNLHDGPGDLVQIRFCDSVYVHDNTVAGGGNDAVMTYRAKNVSVYGNTIGARIGAGVKISSTNAVKIYENTISGSDEAETNGIDLRNASSAATWPMTDIEVYGNTIRNMGRSGVAVYYTSANVAITDSADIHNNLIVNCGGDSSNFAGITSWGFNLRCENNVVDSCKNGGFAIFPGSETVSGFHLFLRNNIFSNSTADTAVVVRRTGTETVYLENNCLFNNLVAYNDSLTNVAENITDDPLFADAAAGDYHVKSKGGRWTGSAWTKDAVSSPCIDSGYAASDYSNEPSPNGGRINIGRYGNTGEASKTYTPTPPLNAILYLSVAPDSTGDIVCDGVNDHVEINAALAMADTSGICGTVYLKGPATYTVDSTIVFGGRITLTGDSTAVVKAKNASAITGYMFYTKNVLNRSINRDITISGFEIDGNRANNTTAYALCTVDSAQSVEIFDMNLHDGPGDLVQIRFSDSVSVHDNTMGGGGNDAILAYRAYHVSVCGNTIAVRTRDGIRLASTNYSQICDNTIYGTTETEVHGIGIRNSSSTATWPMTAIEISGNTIYNLDQSGIYVYCSGTAYVDTTNTVSIHHNKIYRCAGSTAGYAGVTANGFNLRFENNVVDSCANGAFSINPGNDGTVKGLKLSLRNNIFSNSVADTAVVVRRAGTETVYLENNCLFNNLLTYNDSLVNVSENITGDPLFADTANHDYHLQSGFGRWNGTEWVTTDTGYSPCIDAGYADSDYSNEPALNGHRINIGLYGNTAEASKSDPAGISGETPLVFSLAQNVPNPFNPETAITYSIPTSCTVTLSVYNIAGQKVATLVREKQTAGVHTVRWQPANLGSGIYFCRMEAGSFTRTTKMVFVK